MSKLPVVEARQVISVLEKIGFETVRQRGSHLRLKHSDGGVVSVPSSLRKKHWKGTAAKNTPRC